MIALARWLIGIPAAIGRWLAFRQLVTSGPAHLECERNPDRDRQRQAIAARRAFLADLSPNQRAIALMPHGDDR